MVVVVKVVVVVVRVVLLVVVVVVIGLVVVSTCLSRETMVLGVETQRSWLSQRDVPGRKDRKVKSRRESFLLLWKHRDQRLSSSMTFSHSENFDPSAHKVWDSRKPTGCSGSLLDPRLRAVAGSMAYSFSIASNLHREGYLTCLTVVGEY